MSSPTNGTREGATLRFVSGAFAVVVDPEPAELAAQWRAAIEGAGPRAVAVSERTAPHSRTSVTRRRLIDLGAVEHVAVPEAAELSFPEAWKAPVPTLTTDPPQGA